MGGGDGASFLLNMDDPFEAWEAAGEQYQEELQSVFSNVVAREQEYQDIGVEGVVLSTKSRSRRGGLWPVRALSSGNLGSTDKETGGGVV